MAPQSLLGLVCGVWSAPSYNSRIPEWKAWGAVAVPLPSTPESTDGVVESEALAIKIESPGPSPSASNTSMSARPGLSRAEEKVQKALAERLVRVHRLPCNAKCFVCGLQVGGCGPQVARWCGAALCLPRAGVPFTLGAPSSPRAAPTPPRPNTHMRNAGHVLRAARLPRLRVLRLQREEVGKHAHACMLASKQEQGARCLGSQHLN